MVSGHLHATAGLPSVEGSPPICQNRSGRFRYRESELQTSDHEMIPAWGGNGVEVSGALMGLLYIRGIIGLLLMGKKSKVYFRIDPEDSEGSRDIAVRFL